ncbi:MAG: SRPBCC family protein [Gemmatimonadaceae bacterium]
MARSRTNGRTLPEPSAGAAPRREAAAKSAAMLVGSALTVYALKRDRLDFPSLALVIAGGDLIARSLGGDDGALIRQHGAAATVDAAKASKIERTVTINRGADELFSFWRDFANLPQFMEHLESVEVYGARRSRWTAKAPAGRTVTWDAEIVHEIPNRLIGWQSLAGADVPNAGSVHFTPVIGGRGTEVRVVLDYEPPAGRLGRLVAQIFGEEPDLQVREDLRRFKAMMETGEIPVAKPRGDRN